MTKAAKKPKAARRPVYFRVAKLVDPETGELVGALVPRSGVDQRMMRERGYKVSSEIRAELKKPRNVKFHRLAHALGGLLVDQCEAFSGMDQHSAIKKAQTEAGVCCLTEEIDVPGIGTLTRRVPESIAFDEMEEGRFSEFWKGVTSHVTSEYLRGMTPDALEEAILMMDGAR